MPLATKTKINNVFSFSTGSWLTWSDEAPVEKEEAEETETEDSQSIDSDHSSDFFYNFSPDIEDILLKIGQTF